MESAATEKETVIDANPETTGTTSPPPAYSPRRILVPHELRTRGGHFLFKTTGDNRGYVRDGATGEIHRAVRKAKGKAARKIEKVQRRMNKEKA